MGGRPFWPPLARLRRKSKNRSALPADLSLIHIWLGAVAVVMLDPAAPGGLGVIRDDLLRLPEGTAGEIRPEGPRFHHHNLDAQGGHLLSLIHI